MATTWNQFWPDRVREITEAEGISRQEAMKRASAEWKSRSKGGRVSETKVKGAPKLRAEIPMVVEAGPDLAAAWDIAQGILDALRDNAAPASDAAAFRRRAAAAYARAKGPTSEADSTEYQMGQAIAETLLLVAAHEGLTAADWAAMTPPQLQANAGGVRGTVGAAAEGVLSIFGVNADLDGDGDVSSLGAGAEAAAEGVLSLFE